MNFNNGCPPSAPPVPPDPYQYAPGAYDPCYLCSVLREGLYRLMGGMAVTRVRFRNSGGGEREVAYSAGNVVGMRAEIRRLEQECEIAQGRGRAVRAGPGYRPNGDLPFSRYGGRTFGVSPYGGIWPLGPWPRF